MLQPKLQSGFFSSNRGARSHEASGRNGQRAHRRGAYPRGRLDEFKAFPASRRTDWTYAVSPPRPFAVSRVRPLASWLLAPALITVTLITDYFSAAALTFPSPDLNAHGRAYDLSSEFD